MTKKTQGFTLVELMVSVGLVAVVMSMSTSAYLIMIALNREAQAQATGINNLSYALESMVRTIRSGNGYTTPTTCGGFKATLPGEGDVEYCLKVTDGRGQITQNGAALTDPSINITKLAFELTGELKGDATQANVKIVTKGKVNVGAGKDRDFAVETWAVMRSIDL